MEKIILSHQNYRSACAYAYESRAVNPTIFWAPKKGFYVASGLIGIEDVSLGQAHYYANSGGRSHTGSRAEYQPISRAIRSWASAGSTGCLKDIIADEIWLSYARG